MPIQPTSLTRQSGVSSPFVFRLTVICSIMSLSYLSLSDAVSSGMTRTASTSP